MTAPIDITVHGEMSHELTAPVRRESSMTRRIATLGAMAMLVLAGCGSSPSGSSATASPTSTPESAALSSYSTAADLRDAYVTAGGSCSSWNHDKNIWNPAWDAVDAGACGALYDSAFTIFHTPAEVSTWAAAYEDIFTAPTDLLLGDNWLIIPDQDADTAAIAQAIGGRRVTVGGTSSAS